MKEVKAESHLQHIIIVKISMPRMSKLYPQFHIHSGLQIWKQLYHVYTIFLKQQALPCVTKLILNETKILKDPKMVILPKLFHTFSRMIFLCVNFVLSP